ncbi:MAG: L,D-transpeptidase family protein [Bdellovibrionales bacterium]|nr:L,D-transpeptidase family protein [Bdellovibrionales bacterium]
MKALLFSLSLAITMANANAASDVLLIRVFKAERRLELVGKDNRVLKTYKVMLGRTPVGPKTQEGDNKTPEGSYELDLRNPNSSYHKALRVSYPNFKDKLKAKMKGVKPGGDIMLHGFPNDFKEMTSWLDSVGLGGIGDDLIRASLPYFDWTNGCIAVTDDEIDEIYNRVDVPTKIVIQP